MNERDWSALSACALLSYLVRQFSFVCCSLALKQVFAAGLSGQQCINHMNPTAGEAATKGQDLMSSAEKKHRKSQCWTSQSAEAQRGQFTFYGLVQTFFLFSTK